MTTVQHSAPRPLDVPLPEYVYVASSWRNPLQPGVIEVLRAAGIPAYDFRNPEAGTGFSWAEVRPADAAPVDVACAHCGQSIRESSFAGLGFFDIDLDPANDPIVWRHVSNGYAVCFRRGSSSSGVATPSRTPKKGSDYEPVADYLTMLDHPRSREGFQSDFAAMQRADTFVMVLPCGKSAHLELGWAIGAGKRTAILLENPVEPELMYLCADYLATSVVDLLGWMGVQD